MFQVLTIWNLKFSNDLVTAERPKTKILVLDNIYNFPVETFWLLSIFFNEYIIHFGWQIVKISSKTYSNLPNKR